MKSGYLTIITGPMMAGKSEELVRLVRRAYIGKKKVQVFTSIKDTRSGEDLIVTFNKDKLPAKSVYSGSGILSHLNKGTNFVAIDEAQLFDKPDIIETVLELIENKVEVIISQLDKDFRGEPFGFIGPLTGMADHVMKLTSICLQCGEDATLTQRLIEGKPARYNDPTIWIGGSDFYEPRCRRCHIVADAPPMNLRRVVQTAKLAA